MKNLKNKNEFLWDRNKFINRKFLMTEMYQNFLNGDSADVPKVSKWDSEEKRNAKEEKRNAKIDNSDPSFAME